MSYRWTDADVTAINARRAIRNVASITPVRRADAEVTRIAQRDGLYAIVGMCRAAGLPEPVPEYRFHPVRKWRFDYAWAMHKLALEIDGAIWTDGRHSRGSGRVLEMEKMSEAAILGWRVIYATPDDVRSGAVMDRIQRALGAGPRAA